MPRCGKLNTVSQFKIRCEYLSYSAINTVGPRKNGRTEQRGYHMYTVLDKKRPKVDEKDANHRKYSGEFLHVSSASDMLEASCSASDVRVGNSRIRIFQNEELNFSGVQSPEVIFENRMYIFIRTKFTRRAANPERILPISPKAQLLLTKISRRTTPDLAERKASFTLVPLPQTEILSGADGCEGSIQQNGLSFISLYSRSSKLSHSTKRRC